MRWERGRRSENVEEGRGYATPDSFTHGSSEQRVRWFRRGLESGDPGRCNTFDADTL